MRFDGVVSMFDMKRRIRWSRRDSSGCDPDAVLARGLRVAASYLGATFEQTCPRYRREFSGDDKDVSKVLRELGAGSRTEPAADTVRRGRP